MDEGMLRKRNLWAYMMEGVLFLVGVSFLDATAIIPVFIYTYTQSLELAGLATTLNTASSIIAQTVVGPYVNSIHNMPRYIKRIMFICRPLPLLMIPILFASLNPYLTVTVFLVIYALLWASDGLVVVPWGDVLARTIAAEKRGKLLGYQQLWGGIGSLAAGFLIKYTLESTAFTNATRFSILFGSAALFLILAATAFSFTKDLPRTPGKKIANPLHYYRQLPAYFGKNKDFARMAVVRMVGSVTTMISPLVILFGKTLFGLNPAQVSTLIYLQIVGSLVGGLVWGTISSRFGNKFVIMTSQVVGLTLPLLALGCLMIKSLTIPYYILWIIVLGNGMLKGSWLGYMNYTMDVSSEDNRTVFLLLNSLITFPLTFLSFIAGIIADHWGFVPLFILSAVAAVTAICLSTRLKSLKEVREGYSTDCPCETPLAGDE
jgi:MFS family permease